MTVDVTKLPNGLTVVTDRLETVETVSLGVWVQAGARFETAANNGVSHLLEHMAFKGTAKRSARDIAEEIEAVGGHLNAFTSREITAFHATILKDNIDIAIDIIGDILQNSVFDQDELERERAVVLQEIGQSFDTPDDVVFDHFQSTAFPDQPLGRPVLGPPEIVASMTRDTLMGYMGTHYTPQRMIFSAAGKLDHDAVVAMVERQFASLENNDLKEPAAAHYRGGDMREARDLEQAHLVLGFKSAGFHDPDYYAVAVAASVLGGGMSSRLFQEIREKRGLVYSIYGFNSAYSDSGIFGVYAGTGEKGLLELVPSLCDELKRSTSSIQEKELARARAQMRTGIVMSLESTAARAEQIARQIAVFGRVLSIEELIEKVDALRTSDIEQAIARLLSSDPTIAAIGPVGQLPSYEEIAEQLKAA
ncbi:MAG: peptidase M16 [Rhodospirillaceae bacterium]|nr:peptidase M16 [Rhodospirillaceae bacterium]|tara:strand:- start:3167 stop:4429 length:1263 start_codon:yes stop_codon:yes gene_type:complete